MKRLKYPDILRLRADDEFTIVIPPIHRRQSKLANNSRKLILQELKTKIIGELRMSPASKNTLFESYLAKRIFTRAGQPHHEFHVRLVNSPERGMLNTFNLPPSLIKYYMGEGGTGFYVDIIGIEHRKQVLVKFKHLAYLEVHTTRAFDSPFFYDSIKFPRCVKDVTIAKYMTDELLQSKGDVGTYAEILMKYYQHLAVF